MPTTTISRCGGTTVQSFSQAVFSIATTSDLRAYWTLGDGSSPYADTSGFRPADPATQTLLGTGTPMTQDYTPGPLVSGDVGAVGFNAEGPFTGPGDGQWLQTNVSDHRFDISPMSVCTFIRFTASANTFTGLFVGNLTMVAGGPDYQGGWGILGRWPGNFIRFSRGQHNPGGTLRFVETPGGVTAGTWYFVAATYDGTTMRLYVNGALVASGVDGLGADALNNGCMIGLGDIANVWGFVYGQEAQVTVWGTELSQATIRTLAAAAGY